MAYPSYLKSYAPQINLPYPKRVKSLIFDFYEITDKDIYEAKCKECKKLIFVMKGCHVSSSVTSGLTFHLRKHPDLFQEYLDKLKCTVAPDNKSIHDHFKARKSVYSRQTNKFDSDRQYEECERNFHLNPKNCAGVKYVQRDIEIFRNNTNYSSQNKRILEYLHKFTNRNIPVNQLKERCNSIIENDEDIVLDLERLFCPNVCFFDPKYYDDCSYKHYGDFEIFAQIEFQSKFEGFLSEIELYPEFQEDKSFNIQLLKESERIENENDSTLEMNRLLKIILSILVVYKPKIKEKFQALFSMGLTENGLLKPPLGVQLWGPSFKDFDIDVNLDASEKIPEKEFSTFRHVKDKDCPSYTDNSKKLNETARFIGGKAYYPCNFSSCLETCVCIPCQNPNEFSEKDSFSCPDHKIDHPEMFDESEDFSIPRRQYVEFKPDIPIFKRPKNDKFLCPPKIKLAQMKKSCVRCERIFDDHITNHHILHHVCHICSHMKRLSEISFKLTCHICFKKFKDKYSLAGHLQVHNDDNPNYCNECQKGFSSKFNYNNHKLAIHDEKKEEFGCDQCEKTFTSKSNLKRHKETKHVEFQTHFDCQECGKTFVRNDTLRRHTRTEHNDVGNRIILPGVNSEEEPFACYICDKVYKDKNSVIRHIERVHSKITFDCNVCQKQFSRNDTLQLHMIQTHNTERRQVRIICEVCRQEFPGKQELREHRLQYHKDK